jgi:sugar phosphate isomerase/epimerase
MRITLSGRVVEHEEAGFKDLAEFIGLAKRCAYDGVNLRAKQVGPDTSDEEFARVKQALADTGLELVIVDVTVPAEAGQLSGFERLCERVAELGCGLLRAAIMPNTLEPGRQMCDTADRHGLRLSMQMHTHSINETFAMAADWAAKVDRPNFGMTVEPANHLMIGQAFTAENLGVLGDRLFFCNLQSLIVVDEPDERTAQLSLSTGKPVIYKRVPIQTNPQIDVSNVAAALRGVGYTGPINMLDPYPDDEDLETFCSEYATFLHENT